MKSRLSWIGVALVSTYVLGGPAHAADPNGDAIDVSAYKDKLRVITDGKGHYVTLLPFTIGDDEDSGYLFYSSDGKTFYAQRRIGGGRNGNESFDNVFWDPREPDGWQRSFGYRDKKYTVQCGKRTTELKALDKAEGQKLLAGAQFMKARWKRRAYAVARDNGGVYYFVDQAREPEDNRDFRVFKGQKGGLKEQKMVNVVSDSEGSIFVTKAGKLRLVLDKHETSWIEGKNTTKLTMLSLDDDPSVGRLVYTELGVYANTPLGTPCDDM